MQPWLCSVSVVDCADCSKPRPAHASRKGAPAWERPTRVPEPQGRGSSEQAPGSGHSSGETGPVPHGFLPSNLSSASRRPASPLCVTLPPGVGERPGRHTPYTSRTTRFKPATTRFPAAVGRWVTDSKRAGVPTKSGLGMVGSPQNILTPVFSVFHSVFQAQGLYFTAAAVQVKDLSPGWGWVGAAGTSVTCSLD